MNKLARTLTLVGRNHHLSNIVCRSLATEGTGLPLTFACPAKSFYNNVHVKQVDVPSYSGDLGILPQHVPTFAVLKPGIIIVHEDSGKQEKFFVSSGTVTVNPDSSCQVLAEEAVAIGDLDAKACKDELAAAQREMQGASGAAHAEAQIRVETIEAALAAAQA